MLSFRRDVRRVVAPDSEQIIATRRRKKSAGKPVAY